MVAEGLSFVGFVGEVVPLAVVRAVRHRLLPNDSRDRTRGEHLEENTSRGLVGAAMTAACYQWESDSIPKGMCVCAFIQMSVWMKLVMQSGNTRIGKKLVDP